MKIKLEKKGTPKFFTQNGYRKLPVQYSAYSLSLPDVQY